MKKDKQPNKLHSWFKEYFVGYRKQFWYIASMVLTFLSVAVMLISMLFMYSALFSMLSEVFWNCPQIYRKNRNVCVSLRFFLL
jgi:ABC-type bacteriocin/lantibiotic exporter with double-glycine peptidase domain